MSQTYQSVERCSFCLEDRSSGRQRDTSSQHSLWRLPSRHTLCTSTGDFDELQRKYLETEIRSIPRPSPRCPAERAQRKNTDREERVMKTMAACDACLVLTKQYWWADTSPFDMISPPFSADSELPPQNKHFTGTLCSASAIMHLHRPLVPRKFSVVAKGAKQLKIALLARVRRK